VPGGAFSPNGAVRNTIRLNYSLQTEAGISDGVARLGALVARMQA
jgi:DNA-binding transcriptional MocR family regulator